MRTSDHDLIAGLQERVPDAMRAVDAIIAGIERYPRSRVRDTELRRWKSVQLRVAHGVSAAYLLAAEAGLPPRDLGDPRT